MLPSFRSFRRPAAKSRRPRNEHSSAISTQSKGSPPPSLYPENRTIDKIHIRNATRTRRGFIALSTFLLLVSIIFLILVLIGNTHVRPVLVSTYFLRINLTNVVPRSVPNSVLINSIARTLGLHDFYQVGVWSYCEGFNTEGVTSCSSPQKFYWFNPVEIILNQLLAGAVVALPADITRVLGIARLASHWMFGLYITGAALTGLCFLVTWTSLYTRWASLPNVILNFLAALTTTAATIIATVMFIIFRNVFKGAPQLNIEASVGIQMYAFMWIASGCNIISWLIQFGMCCCCISRRDVKRGRRQKEETGAVEIQRKTRKRFGFGRKSV